MLSKFAGMTAVIGATLTIVSGVQAYGFQHNFVMPSNDIKVENEHTYVKTISVAEGLTGGNVQNGMLMTQRLTTGGVVGASAIAQSEVNSTYLPSCGCNRVGDITVENEHTKVATVAKVQVATGGNTQNGGMLSRQKITTGGVQSIGTQATSLVNYTGFSVSPN